jgi:uridine phosphorylase
MPIPSLVVCTGAIRDEGTSYHYLPPARLVEASPKVANLLETELKTLPIPVLSGVVWTTDAPYRETKRQISNYAKAGVLAVEMQAASLFAFAQAHNFPTGVVAYVSNGVDQAGERFDKGTLIQEFEVLRQVCRAGKRFVSCLHQVDKL